MSYILDALRRAEAERERGGVPGLHAQAVGTAASAPAGITAGGGRWTVPVLVGLVVAVVLLGWRPWAADAVAPSEPVPARPAAVVQLTGNPVPASQPPGRAAPESLPTAPEPTPPLRPPEAAARRAVVAPVPAAAAARKRTASAASGAPTEASAGSGAASAAAAEGKVYAIAELPPEIRQQLPALTIGGSIYSAQAQSRFVIVNGQLFHEGDTLAPGLVLQQIRLKSAVLAFRGYRYGVTF